MKNKFVLSLALIASFLCSSANALTLNEAQGVAYNATCRVSVSDALGTGVVIGYDSSKNMYLVLTNYHVVRQNSSAVCDFWVNGKLTSCKSVVLWRSFNSSTPTDFCILGVQKDFIERNNIKSIPLAGNEYIDLTDAFFVSAGCPKGTHAGSWKGVTIKNGESVEFKPAPYPGQSGSGVFKIIDDELWYVGTITWRIGSETDANSYGAYIPVTKLYQALKTSKFPVSYQKEPWVAPPGYEEIAEKTDFHVIEITMQDCPACVKALEDVDKLLDEGVDVASMDVVDCDEAMKTKYRATKFPTFALIGSNGDVIETWVGYGCSGKILRKIEELTKKSETETLVSDLSGLAVINELESNIIQEPIIDKSFSEPTIDQQEPQQELQQEPQQNNTIAHSFESQGIVAVDDDFRKRKSVEESYNNVGFFEDNQAHWDSRVNRNNKSSGSEKQESTKQDESKSNGALATRIGNELEVRFNKIGDAAEKRADVFFNKKSAEIKCSVKSFFVKAFWIITYIVIAEIILISIVSKFFWKLVKKFLAFIAKKILKRCGDEKTGNDKDNT